MASALASRLATITTEDRLCVFVQRRLTTPRDALLARQQAFFAEKLKNGVYGAGDQQHH